jgi:hypothetical protein
MKPRTVIVTVELVSDDPLKDIRARYQASDVRQVKVQVAQPVRAKAVARRPRRKRR